MIPFATTSTFLTTGSAKGQWAASASRHSRENFDACWTLRANRARKVDHSPLVDTEETRFDGEK